MIVKDNIQLKIVEDSVASNMYIYFGSDLNFAKIYSSSQKYLDENWGLFFVKSDSNFIIYKSTCFVDMYRAVDQRLKKHILREELTQSLGLGRDSYKYPTSMFYQLPSDVIEYSEFDRYLIKLLYHPNMQTGLDSISVLVIMDNLINEIVN